MVWLTGMVWFEQRFDLCLLQQVGRVSTKYKKSKSGAASAMASTLSFEQRHGVDGTFGSFEIVSGYMSKQFPEHLLGLASRYSQAGKSATDQPKTVVWLISSVICC